ncbi:LysM peptidoglycan-binding domain-containing protein [Candidatus Woesebacteria bacterium]|nr:LysM peptidoglycan-binding domain-containing protein [Candidatus Woesebacteria bacterium]
MKITYQLLIVVIIASLGAFFYYSKMKPSESITELSSPTPSSSENDGTTQDKVANRPETYTVQKGDNLTLISEKFYNNRDQWELIAKENGITNSNLIAIGQVLTLPKLKGEDVVAGPIGISLEEVAKHSIKEDCWLAIEGKVYDVTQYIAAGFHPGKLAILMGCGKDATELFNTRPMSKNPSAHSSRAREMLPKYFIADLAQ